MPSRDWWKLSEPTRKRYTGSGAKQSGMTAAEVKAYYESGGSLKGLRGHAKTPEKPSDVLRSKSPDKYREYVEKRHKFSGGSLERKPWADKFVKNYQKHFGENEEFNRKKLIERTQISDPSDPLYIHTADLIVGANSSKDEIAALAQDADENYGKRKRNPFHYH